MDYVLKKSKRKTVAIEINPEGVLIVKAPLHYTNREAEQAIKNSEKWINKHLPDVLNKKDALSLLTKKDITIAKKAVKSLCEMFVAHYSAIMNVEPESIKVTSAKKRFGSCSYNNQLCFSYLLILQPINAIKYVVVHELAHIKHHNHSKDFHSFVESVLPNSKQYEKLLSPKYSSYANFKENLEILGIN